MSQDISKREKKRVQDRNAQRAARQRTKDRLALLELQVSQLQGGADKALSDELRQMRDERDELRRLADHLVSIAEAMKSTLNSSDDKAAQARTEGEHTETDPGLISRIFLDYEDLKTVDSTPFSPLCDTHIIVYGVLNGWDDPVSENEEPIQRLLAYLHSRFMLLRPLARPIDQLALLYLVQTAFLSLLTQHSGCHSYALQIPGWLRPIPIQMSLPHNISIDMLPWPQLRSHLLSTQSENAIVTHNEACETFAMDALRDMYFSPALKFEDAYEISLDRRLAVSPQFRQHFAPTSVSCPFAVGSDFFNAHPNLRGFVPEFVKEIISRPQHCTERISELASLSPFNQPCLILEKDLEIPKLPSSHDKPSSQGLCGSEDANLCHQVQPLNLMDPTEGDFGGEPSSYWHDSVELMGFDDIDATWLLRSTVTAESHDQLSEGQPS
ncbi:uncharacterized protein BO87DRAFT_379668 [Aspergillus neoniger CBS 115656]|uniref:BZIP domain-containing protein n=1 Tax=Aspergillus neoniger (strain CBS 115656) TaxID=1448310 RepID=A0A318YD03_ASPNB|nr:hypothetical protein BO87DRAFT_379668 [Aspergillus neoniger CBS 115656]PYH30550.1 hypothetical protein BO87DRAFT_379668 [Aspergillus neoniger CBS 115656]